MKDILVLGGLVLIMWIISRIALKEPLLPWKEKKRKEGAPQVKFKKSKVVEDDDEEEIDADPFQELFPNVISIEKHMIRQDGNKFSVMAEVHPVNYFLMNPQEQEAVDAVFETWLAQVEQVRWYLQNRFVDLTDPIEEIQRTMQDEEDLHPLAIEYGNNMIQDLVNWQTATPRYETKRFMIFDFTIDEKDIKADSAEELEEKVVEKAFNELHRRLAAAQMQLRKANMEVQMLTTDGISETLYYQFNRRKALKSRYRDFEEKEKLALYVTADQSATQVLQVKGEIEDAEKQAELEKEKAS